MVSGKWAFYNLPFLAGRSRLPDYLAKPKVLCNGTNCNAKV
jgi:hypothetical protein